MTSVLIQVTFRFGPALEARYLETPPAPGDHVHSSSGKIWAVSNVLTDDEHNYLVVCAPLSEPT